MEKNNGWFEGAAPGFPSTNNGLESINAQIKREGTFRERLPLGAFFQCIFKILTDWTRDRDPASANFKPFASSPSVGHQLQSEGYDLAKLRGASIRTRRSKDNQTQYFIPSWKQRQLTENDIKTFLQTRAKFDTYQKWKQRVHVVVLNNQNWIASTCSCSKWQKQYVCKHVVGVATLKGLYKIPEAARTDPIGRKRKVGRPKKAAKALVRD